MSTDTGIKCPTDARGAAEYLMLTERQVHEEERAGRLKCYRILGNRKRFTRDQLDEYMRSHPLNKRGNA